MTTVPQHKDFRELCKAYIVLELQQRLQQLDADIQKYEEDIACSAADALRQKKENLKTVSSRFVLEKELQFKKGMIESLNMLRLEAKKLFVHNMAIIESSSAFDLGDLSPINRDFPMRQVSEYASILLDECRCSTTEDTVGVCSVNDLRHDGFFRPKSTPESDTPYPPNSTAAAVSDLPDTMITPDSDSLNPPKSTTPPESDQSTLLQSTTPPVSDQSNLLQSTTPPESDQSTLLQSTMPPESDQSTLLQSTTPPESDQSNLLQSTTPPESDQSTLLQSTTPPEFDQSTLLQSTTPPESGPSCLPKSTITIGSDLLNASESFTVPDFDSPKGIESTTEPESDSCNPLENTTVPECDQLSIESLKDGSESGSPSHDSVRLETSSNALVSLLATGPDVNIADDSVRLETKSNAYAAGGFGNHSESHTGIQVTGQVYCEQKDAAMHIVATENDHKDDAQNYQTQSGVISEMVVANFIITQNVIEDPDSKESVQGCGADQMKHKPNKRIDDDHFDKQLSTNPIVTDKSNINDIAEQKIISTKDIHTERPVKHSLESRPDQTNYLSIDCPSADGRQELLSRCSHVSNGIMSGIKNDKECEQETPAGTTGALTGGPLTTSHSESVAGNGSGPQPVDQARTSLGCQAINEFQAQDFPGNFIIIDQNYTTPTEISVGETRSLINDYTDETRLTADVVPRGKANSSCASKNVEGYLVSEKAVEIVNEIPIHGPDQQPSSAVDGCIIITKAVDATLDRPQVVPAELSIADGVTESHIREDKLDPGFEDETLIPPSDDKRKLIQEDDSDWDLLVSRTSIDDFKLSSVGKVKGSVIRGDSDFLNDGEGVCTSADAVKSDGIHAMEIACGSPTNQITAYAELLGWDNDSIRCVASGKAEEQALGSQVCEFPNDDLQKILIDVLKLEPVDLERLANTSPSFTISESTDLDISVVALQNLDNSIVKALSVQKETEDDQKHLLLFEQPAGGFKSSSVNGQAESKPREDDIWVSDEEDFEMQGAVGPFQEMANGFSDSSESSTSSEAPDDWSTRYQSDVEVSDTDSWETVGKKKKVKSTNFNNSSATQSYSFVNNDEKMVLNPLANERCSGENSITRKTQMCKSKGRCIRGKLCNYAHSEQELLEAREKFKEYKRNQLKLRSDESTSAHRNVNEGHKQNLRRKTVMCEHFKKHKDCLLGDDCNFAHSETELQNALKKLKEATQGEKEAEKLADIFPLLGQNSETEGMSFANVVRPKIPNYKAEMCRGFAKGTCNLSPESCKYAHSEWEIDPKLNHPEPCQKQFCPNRLKYEKQKTKMCPALNHCKWGESCGFAHSESELRPMPKTECCSRIFNNRKCLPSAECPYAHSIVELLSKISEKKTTSIKGTTPQVNAGLSCPYAHSKAELRTTQSDKKTTPTQGTTPKVNARINHPYTHLGKGVQPSIQPSKDFKHIAAAAVAKDNDNDCTICFDALNNDRKVLACGHSSWHLKCIKNWVEKEGKRTCPKCRKAVDPVQVPSFLSDEDFPHLY